MKILENREMDEAWNFIDKNFKFTPSVNSSITPFKIDRPHNVFELLAYWNEAQEKIVNEIFKSLNCKYIFALDWQHDCFLFNPCEEIPYGMTWHDDNRDCQVYFPSYYPNGDYHFFISIDYSFGLLGHPWRKEIWVFGQNLIRKFENNKTLLMLRDKIVV